MKFRVGGCERGSRVITAQSEKAARRLLREGEYLEPFAEPLCVVEPEREWEVQDQSGRCLHHVLAPEGRARRRLRPGQQLVELKGECARLAVRRRLLKKLDNAKFQRRVLEHLVERGLLDELAED